MGCAGGGCIQISRTRRVNALPPMSSTSSDGFFCRIFPIVSGFRVSWDSRRLPGTRVLGVWLLQEAPIASPESPGSGTPALIDGEFVERVKHGRMYKIVTREYMATGHCGYTALLGHNYLIGSEDGKPMSSLVREYLLGVYQYTERDVSM